MSGPGFEVTPSPASLDDLRRDIPHDDPMSSMSSSASDSARLLALFEAPADGGDPISSASNNDMDDTFQEPTASANFPEMLVQDLETSEAVFMSKSMTAGCPSEGLQQPSDQHEPYSIPGRGMIRPPTPRFGCRSTSQPRRHSLISGRLDLPYHHDHHQEETNGNHEYSDSESDASLGMDPPPSIRTRGQSITTAATSVSGRRSSSVSQKLQTPSSPTSSHSSPPSPTMARNNHHEGSWYDADGEEEADAEAESDSGPLHKVPEIPEVQPRIVNIPPVAIPRRRSSLNRDHGRTMSNSSTMSLLELGATTTTALQNEQPVGCGGSLPLQPSPSMQLLATSNGRTVIDVSRPSTGNLKLAAGRRQIASPIPDDLDEPHCTHHEQAPCKEAQTGHVIATHRRSIAHVEAWNNAAAERLIRAQPSIIFSPTTSFISGIPLPPDVMETLRVSITCFPETMLLSSSLSIETIRTYSKKIKHRGRFNISAEKDFPDDTRSMFSTTTSEPPKRAPKRWNLHWFGHGHGHGQRDSKKDQYEQFPPSSPVAKKVQLDAPLEANWAAIKTIFPHGSDYLCDALYAHVLAYNYISTLCPPNPQPLIHDTSGVSMNDSATGGRRIPKKAASVLGMQTLAKAPTGHLQHRQSISRRLFRKDQPNDDSCEFNSKSNKNNISVEIQPGIRDIQAGLERCIVFLVATLKKTEGNNGCGEYDDETASVLIRDQLRRSESEDVGVDVVLIRALCEVVRMGEV